MTGFAKLFAGKNWEDYLEPKDRELLNLYRDTRQKREKDEPGFAEFYARNFAAIQNDPDYQEEVEEAGDDLKERAYIAAGREQRACGFFISTPDTDPFYDA